MSKTYLADGGDVIDITEYEVRRIISRDIAKSINTKNEIMKQKLNCNGTGFIYDLNEITDEYCEVLSDMHTNPSNQN
jgi:hypothetical protein